MKRKIASVMLAVSCMISMAACGSQKEANPQPSSAQETTVTTPESVQKETQKTDTTEAEKENSGKVVVYMPSPSGLNEK